VRKSQIPVRVFPHEGIWFVGCGAGYYNYPMPKAEAIRKAMALAQARATEREEPVDVEVYDELGNVVEVLQTRPPAYSRTRQSAVPATAADHGRRRFSHLFSALWPDT
jgi:hypothetical protein